MSPAPIVLASTSSYRKALLERLRLPFRCVAPGVDEALARGAEREPAAIAARLARAKAEAVARREPDAVVIGSDQVCALGEEVLGKPGTAERAVAQLLRLAGRSHRLFTAVAIVHRGGCVAWVEETILEMRALGAEEAARYVAADAPLDCAGSYKIESLGIALFERVVAEDASSIVGLPLLRTSRELRLLGHRVP